MGQYDFVMDAVSESVDTSEVGAEELAELLSMVGGLRVSPMTESVLAASEGVLAKLRAGASWASLDDGERFNAVYLRAAVRAHVQRAADEVRRASP